MNRDIAMTIRMTLFSCVLIGSAAVLAAPKEAPVAYSSVVPVLDGDIEGDPAWKGVPWAGEGFTILRKPDAPTRATRFKALYTADALYLAVECAEPEPAKMRYEERPVEFYNYDVTELFLEATPGEVIHLIFSARDSQNEQIDGKTLVRTKGQTAWTAKSRIEADRWTTEYLIPLALIAADPSSATVTVPFNMCRHTTPDNQYSTWNPTDGFSSRAGFGRLVLRPAPPAVAARVAALAKRPHPLALRAKWKAVREDPFWRETFAANAPLVQKLEKLAAQPDLGGETEAFDDGLGLLDSRKSAAETAHRARLSNSFFGHP